MTLKRAYLIVVLAFAWFIAFVALGSLLHSSDERQGIGFFLVAIVGLSVGLTVGTSEIAIGKGYSIWLGLTLGLAGPFGLLVVELLPDRSGFPR